MQRCVIHVDGCAALLLMQLLSSVSVEENFVLKLLLNM